MPSQQRAYIKSVIKLFSNKLKETSCITAQAFSELLQQLPGVIQNYLVVKHQPNKDLFSCEKRVYTILEETFLAKFDFFKEKPEEFFTTLSHDIVNALHKETSLLDEDIPREQLAQSAIRLLDICLNKLTWNPEEPTTLWPLVKTISLQLEDFFEKNIITNIDDLDDLFWSLIHRFCFFLDIAGADLPPECFALIKEELSNGNLLLIDLEEQEQCIETKLARLQRGIHEAEVKKHAYERGILVH